MSPPARRLDSGARFSPPVSPACPRHQLRDVGLHDVLEIREEEDEDGGRGELQGDRPHDERPPHVCVDPVRDDLRDDQGDPVAQQGEEHEKKYPCPVGTKKAEEARLPRYISQRSGLIRPPPFAPRGMKVSLPQSRPWHQLFVSGLARVRGLLTLTSSR